MIKILDELEYQHAGDGQCKLTDTCKNHNNEYCFVCMFNTSATPRDYYEGELRKDVELNLDDLIET